MRALLCAVLLLTACKTAESETKPAPPAAVSEAKPAEAPHEHAVAANAPPPVFDDLGTWHHAVQASPQAQVWFDQGLRLMYAFNHEEAIKAFQRGAEIDPKCAMCLWGAALALGPNINLPTDPDREKMAWDLVARARAAGPQGAEKDYVEAVAKRYTNPPGPDRRAVDKAYADAIREPSRKHPDDVDAA